MSDSKLINQFNEILGSGIEVSFDELKAQLLKDLQLAGLSFDADSVSDMKKLIIWTSDVCRYLIEKDFESYMNLLYRIDVKAERFIELNESESGYDSNEIAATLVLQREIDKIRMRKKYS